MAWRGDGLEAKYPPCGPCAAFCLATEVPAIVCYGNQIRAKCENCVFAKHQMEYESLRHKRDPVGWIGSCCTPSSNV